jgi:hypothetical protein
MKSFWDIALFLIVALAGILMNLWGLCGREWEKFVNDGEVDLRNSVNDMVVCIKHISSYK